MSILLVEASLHLSLAPFFPLTIHPSHHSSLSPSPLSPFTPFIDLLVACFGKKSLTIHLSHHSNYRSGYTRTHWKTTRAILRPVRWRSFLPTKGTSALSLSHSFSLSLILFALVLRHCQICHRQRCPRQGHYAVHSTVFDLA